REEVLGVSARAGGSTRSDQNAVLFADGERDVAVGLYPRDPELPRLPRAALPTGMMTVLNEYQAFPSPVAVDQITLEVIGYRPRRRAGLRCGVTPRGQPPTTLYVKVLRERNFAEVLQRHELLLAAGVPSPPVAAATGDHLLVLRELTGRPLARAIFDPVAPCTAQ